MPPTRPLPEQGQAGTAGGHRWGPGESGNPGGRPKGYIPFAPMLRRELTRLDRRNRSQMEKIAAKVVAMAVAGDMDAIRWLSDRVDGKVAQSIQVDSQQTVHVVPWLPHIKEAVNAVDFLPGAREEAVLAPDPQPEDPA